jgi:hypothetical protein
MMGATWMCESCGKLTDGLPGVDDAMDCFCQRCRICGELSGYCLCDDDDDDLAHFHDEQYDVQD